MKPLLNTFLRVLRSLKRPSKRANTNRLHQRGETINTLIIREATTADISALAALHAKTWSDTYPRVVHPPTFRVREYQWKEQFKTNGGNWCCFVVENNKGRLVGFTKGIPYHSPDLPDFTGELSKIYLLREYQRLGLGSKLMAQVVHRFLSQGITAMVLFADPDNPSCRFYEALGGEKLYDHNGAFHGAYGWRNLNDLLLKLR